jgi:transposase-like protein
MAGSEDHDEGEPSARDGATDAPPVFRRPPLLPKNLEGTLRHLDDGELAWLLTATMAEHERRGLARSDAGQLEPGREDVRKEEPATATAVPGIAGLTQAQVNLVQAAFKAGVKPSAIARQFGISPKLIQKVLAKKGR